MGFWANLFGVSNKNLNPQEQKRLNEKLLDVCKYGKEPSIDKLLESGADPNCVNTDNTTPLMFATYNGHLHFVRSLLKSKADPNALNCDNQNALAYACMQNHYEIAKALIESGSNLDNVCVDNMTPLMQATAKGYMSIAELLIKKGADINLMTKAGGFHHNALSFAESNDQQEMVEFLAKHGAKRIVHTLNDE